jgi:hypothetical protein
MGPGEAEAMHGAGGSLGPRMGPGEAWGHAWGRGKQTSDESDNTRSCLPPGACRQGAYFYGDLWRFWYEGLPSGCVKFGHPVTDQGDDPMRPTIAGKV